jgi:hypothetical protein
LWTEYPLIFTLSKYYTEIGETDDDYRSLLAELYSHSMTVIDFRHQSPTKNAPGRRAIDHVV